MAFIGKNVIENLTTGMYEDAKIIYREYIQNSADSIDQAIKTSLLKKNEAYIDVTIPSYENNIFIEDNAMGISVDNFKTILSDIAASNKDKTENKGFRGIGRLGGLAYCNKLIFESSYKGENKKSIMTWDAKKLREIINDINNNIEASLLIDNVTTYETQEENIESHYFKVSMIDVLEENDELLNITEVKQYLEEVAPVPYVNKFIYRNAIYDFIKNNGFKLDEYNIKLNGEDIFKQYTSDLYKYKNDKIKDDKSKEIYDKISDIVFEKLESNEIVYGWLWYGICRFEKQLPSINRMRGLRIRKENIQIGTDNTLSNQNLFKEPRSNYYFIGEIHVTHTALIPNARRDYFNQNYTCNIFENILKEITYDKLYDIYHFANNYKNAVKKISNNSKEVIILEKDIKSGKSIDSDDLKNKNKKLEQCYKVIETNKSEINKIKNRYADKLPTNLSDRIYKAIDTHYTIDKIECKNNISSSDKPNDYVDIKSLSKNQKYLSQELSQLNKKEQLLVSNIYRLISKFVPETISNDLIAKIHNSLKNEYRKKNKNE